MLCYCKIKLFNNLVALPEIRLHRMNQFCPQQEMIGGRGTKILKNHKIFDSNNKKF